MRVRVRLRAQLGWSRRDRWRQPDAAIIIEVGAPESNGAEAPRPDGVDVGSVETFDIRRRVYYRYTRYSRPGGVDSLDLGWFENATPSDFSTTVYEHGPQDLRGAARVDERVHWCEADPNRTDRAVELWRDASRELRDAAVDVTTCVRLAETAWDSSHAYPQYLVSARAERQLLWDLADRADRTAELLEEIRDEQRASKDAERDFWEEIAWDAAFTVASLLRYGAFGMAARIGRAALVAAAGTSALGRLATIVTNIATKVRALPIYLRAPITGLAWGTGGAANYAASETLATAIRPATC